MTSTTIKIDQTTDRFDSLTNIQISDILGDDRRNFIRLSVLTIYGKYKATWIIGIG